MSSSPEILQAQLEQIILDEQLKMKREMGFIEDFVPNSDAPAKCSIFLSPNWNTCSRLLLLIVTGRGIQPGIWSRSLIMEAFADGTNQNHHQHSRSYRNGSMLPYLQVAMEKGYGVIVMNPSTNSIQNGNEKVLIPYSSTPEEHVNYVWEKYEPMSVCTQVFIVAYGRGGDLAKNLIVHQPKLPEKLKAVAFIESSHRVSETDSDVVRDVINTIGLNWQRSAAPVSTEIPGCSQLGCMSLSAGEPVSGHHLGSNTAWTISSTMLTVFSYFESTHGNSDIPPENFDSLDDAEMMVVDDEIIEEGKVRGKSMVVSTSMGVNDFYLLSVVGKGAYGKVFLAKKKSGRNTGKVYAMKVLKKTDVFKKKQVEHTKSEQRILKHVEHPFVVRLRYAFQTDFKLYLVTDYYNGGSLFVHLRRSKRFEEDRAKFYAAQLFSAIAHLHSLHIMYRDLKLENILMDSKGNISITDFGLSKEDDEGSTFVGTPEYLAPELLSSQRTATSYGKSVDWWSYGVLVYEMIRGNTPFWDKNRRQMFQNILTGEPYFDPEIFSPRSQSFLRALLIKDPTRRMGCGERGPAEIVDHEWFAGMDWQALTNKRIDPPFKPLVGQQTDTNYVPSVFRREIAADSPVEHVLGETGPGRQTMHFDDFSYMGSDIMGSRRASMFRESDLRMELEDNTSMDE